MGKHGSWRRWAVLGAMAGLLLPLGAGAQEAEQPLFRLRRVTPPDRLLTASCDERADAAYRGRYRAEGIAGYTLPGSLPGAVPLFRFVRGAPGRHFYTINRAEGEERQFRFEGVVGFLGQAPGPGAVALVRLFDRRTGDHLYATNPREIADVVRSGRFQVEQTMGYLHDRHDDPCPIR